MVLTNSIKCNNLSCHDGMHRIRNSSSVFNTSILNTWSTNGANGMSWYNGGINSCLNFLYADNSWIFSTSKLRNPNVSGDFSSSLYSIISASALKIPSSTVMSDNRTTFVVRITACALPFGRFNTWTISPRIPI